MGGQEEYICRNWGVYRHKVFNGLLMPQGRASISFYYLCPSEKMRPRRARSEKVVSVYPKASL